MKSLFEREGTGSNVSLLLHHATRALATPDAANDPTNARGCPLAWARTTFGLTEDHERIDLLAHLGASPGPEALPLAAAIDGRCSARSYSARPLTLAAIARFWRWTFPTGVRAEGYQPLVAPHGTLTNWNGHVTLVRPVMLARNVEGLEVGAYYVDERNLTLHKLAGVDPHRLAVLMEEACFQAEFRFAPALCLMVGSLAEAIERYGDRGYRYMLLENGVQLQRQGLAAAALGLAGCITGSFSQDSWDRWLRLDGFHGSVLNGYALGHSERTSALANSIAAAQKTGGVHAGR